MNVEPALTIWGGRSERQWILLIVPLAGLMQEGVTWWRQQPLREAYPVHQRWLRSGPPWWPIHADHERLAQRIDAGWSRRTSQRSSTRRGIPPREIEPLTPDQARKLLEVANGDRLGAVISVATALRLRGGADVSVLTIRRSPSRERPLAP